MLLELVILGLRFPSVLFELLRIDFSYIDIRRHYYIGYIKSALLLGIRFLMV